MKAYHLRTLVQVARALSLEYGVQVTMGGSGAYTAYPKNGGKPRINIPAVDLQDKEYLTLVRGYVDHEVAHVRCTESLGWQKYAPQEYAGKPMAETMANIYEDVFVEREIGKYYPGCKKNVAKLVDLIFRERWEGTELMDGEDTDEHAAMLWHYIFQYTLYSVRSVPAPSLSGIHKEYRIQLDTFLPGLAAELDTVTSRAPQEGVSTAANVKLACETMDIIAKYIRDNGAGGQGDGGEGLAGHYKGEPRVPSNMKGDPAQVRDLMDKMEGLRNQKQSDVGAYDIARQIIESIEEMLEEHPDAVRAELMRGASDERGDGLISDMPDDEELQARATSTMLDAQLRSLMQTFVLNRGGAARRGKLDTRRLHRLACNNVNIFNRRIEKQGVNTEVMILVDQSGSMGGAKALIASQALYAIMLSLSKIQGVKVGAMGFSSNNMVNILSPGQRVTRHCRIRARGGTQCGEALLEGLQKFSNSVDSRKIVFMLTDGETSNGSYFLHAIDMARRMGVEFLGIGIQDSSITQYLEADECCVINKLHELTPNMFRMLRHKLLGGAA